MKKMGILAFVFAFVAVSVCAASCKKQTTTQSNVRTFEKYFSTCTATTATTTKTYESKALFERDCDTYTTIKFVGDTEWTNGLVAQKVVFEFLGNKTCDMDIEITLITNGEETKSQKLVQFEKDKIVELEVDLGKTLKDQTTISIIVKDPGKNNIAGSIFDENGISNGFLWKINGATLFGEHK